MRMLELLAAVTKGAIVALVILNIIAAHWQIKELQQQVKQLQEIVDANGV